MGGWSVAPNVRADYESALRMTPFCDVVSVDSETEEIGRHKTNLRRAQCDDTDDGAIGGCHDPALPHATAHQDGRKNCQQTRKVVETKDHNANEIPGASR